MVRNPGQLGGKADINKDHMDYDEYREGQTNAEIQEETFDFFLDQLEIAYDLPEEEKKELLAEIHQEMQDEDPYIYFVYQQFLTMSDAQRGLIEGVAEGRPYSEEEMVAFVDMITGLDFVETGPDTVFKLSYLKVIMEAMDSNERIDFMLTMADKMPVGRDGVFINSEETYVIGVMQAMGMVTEDEVETYTMERGHSVYAEIDLAAEVELEYEGILEDLIVQTAGKAKYTSSAYEYQSGNPMDEKATLGNLGKIFGLFVAGGTLFSNAGGALGKLIVERDIAGAINHIKNHHYIGPAIIALLGFSRSIKNPDASIAESIMPPDRMYLRALIDSDAQVERDAISYMRNEDIYNSVDDTLDRLNRDDIDKMRHGDIKTAFPDVEKILDHRGLVPELEEDRKSLTNQLVEIWLSLKGWGYSNYDKSHRFLLFCEEKYSKEKELQRLRKEDEAEERRLRGEDSDPGPKAPESPEAPEETVA